MASIKPMLACECIPEQVKYPVIVQPKLDGIRFIIKDGEAVSRNLKPLRNEYLQSKLWGLGDIMEGLDGEVMVGSPTNPNVFRITTSAVMSQTGEPNFTLHLFDLWNTPGVGYSQRYDMLLKRNLPLDIVSIVENRMALDEQEMMAIHVDNIKQGYEGSILRHPRGIYKFNRSTMREGYLVKLKDFKDAEAVIIGFEPKYHNANPATTDARGYTKRSAHQENMHALDTLGALRVSLGKMEFRIGTGFDDSLRKEIWESRETLIGRVVKFKYHESGNYDLPRFPVFLGFRDPIDTGVNDGDGAQNVG